MTVPVAVRKAGPYAGNGVQVTYPFAFKIFATTDLVVTKTALPSAGSGESTLVLTNDYSVLMNADQDNNPGGSVTLVVAPAGDGTNANSELITITSAVPESQQTSLPQGGQFSAKVVEKALDKVTLLVGQLSEKLGRVLKYPVSDTTTAKDLPTAAQRANQFLAFDANGDPIAASSPSGGVVSAAMQPVVAAATTGTALTNLGFSAFFKTLIGAATVQALRTLFTPLTTKGDLWVFGAADTRQAVGTDGQLLSGDSTQAAGLRYIDPGFRGYLSGCQLTWVSGTSITVGAGSCRDDADTENLKLAAALTMSNLTVGWAVGNNQPKIRTGVVLANGMTLHVYVIKRTDTGVVDVLLSDEASNPTLPANYTKSRRVASIRFGAGVQTIPQFVQHGDDFAWFTPPALDKNGAGTSANRTLTTMTIPTGLPFWWYGRVTVAGGASGAQLIALTDPAVADVAPGGAATPLTDGEWSGAASSTLGFTARCWTNSSAQIGVRVFNTTDAFQIQTMGWIDRRGRDA